jgi:hypothetical protein
LTLLLDDELLGRFEQALDAVGAAITRSWAPGLKDAEIDALIAPHGFQLPEEARRWWRWHNGVLPGTTPPDWDLTPRRPLLDLADALEVYAAGRGAWLQLYGVDHRWLEPVGDRPSVYFACAVGPEDPVPVYIQQDIEEPIQALPSIGELVKTWTDLIDTGVFTTDAQGSWEWDFDKIPEDIWKLGIA